MKLFTIPLDATNVKKNNMTEVNFLKDSFLEIDTQFNYWTHCAHRNKEEIQEVV
jgi:hypothetical protein